MIAILKKISRIKYKDNPSDKYYIMIKKIQKTQIFRGFSSQSNNKSILYDTTIIKQDLVNYFNTRKGERVMMPSYGTIIWDCLFEPFTELLRDEIIEDVRKGINLEPRVVLINLLVDQIEHGIIIQAEVEYKPFNVTDTFVLSFDQRSESVRIG